MIGLRNTSKQASARTCRRASGGFTISEVLICVMILAIAGAALTQALSMGMGQFHARASESEAITLGNEIAVEVRDQLAFATSYDSNPAATGGTGAEGSATDALAENGQFISTANTLKNVPCQIVSVDEDGKPVAAAEFGYVALRYSVEQTSGSTETFNFFPVSKAEYDKDTVKLGARVDYEYDAADGLFNVKVTVRDSAGRIPDRVQEFAVTPIASMQ